MGSTNQLARDYRVEVSTTGAAGSWVRTYGLNSFNPDLPPVLQDSTEYENDGWGTQELTGYNWKLTLGLYRQATGGVEDPAFALMRACQGQFGDSARLYVRWYRKDGLPEAWQGRGVVTLSKAKTGVTDLDAWNVTFTGSGMLSPITNPYAPAAAPTVLSATPSAAATGQLVTITGTGFTGTVSVAFGGVDSTDFVVLGDSVIIAAMPTGAAGAAAVVVTNATGASTALAYTRGA